MVALKMLLTILAAANCALGCTLYRGGNYEVEEGPNRIKRDIASNCGPGDPWPPNRVNTTDRLLALRQQMDSNGLSAYYVPLDEERRRTWISGFSGSNGDSIVTINQAAAWTDGRYFLQASNELDCNWELMKMGQPGVPDYAGWLTGDANLAPGSKIGADPTLMGAQTWLELEAALAKANLVLLSVPKNLIDEIWTVENGRPEFTPKDIVVHPMIYAGKSFEEKIGDLRRTLTSLDRDAMVVSESDEVAWLFNLRGEGSSTIEGLMVSPLFQSLCLVTQTEIRLWLHPEKVTPELVAHLQAPGCGETNTCVMVGDFNSGMLDLATWSAENAKPLLLSVLITKPSTYLTGASYAVYQALTAEVAAFGDSPVLHAKATKNEVEVRGMINAHIRDAYALCEFFSFMEDQIVNQKVKDWDEMKAADRLKELRLAQTDSKGESFPTIAASGSNGAVIHYMPAVETVAMINDSAVFLVDSGGQYLDGTTDVTRTFHYGSPDAETVEMYTRVLMGHIDLAKTIVPNNTLDRSIDLVTRQHIFEKGLDFRHGTGHGIGAYLQVHEGPTRIAMSGAPAGLTENMFFSDEPGYYKDGAYGIRIESIVRVVNKDFADNTYGNFIGFEPVTLVPFEPNLTDFSLMSPAQIEWYNGHSQLIRDKVRPHFVANGRSDVVEWIDAKTQFVDPAVSNMVQKYLKQEKQQQV